LLESKIHIEVQFTRSSIVLKVVLQCKVKLLAVQIVS